MPVVRPFYWLANVHSARSRIEVSVGGWMPAVIGFFQNGFRIAGGHKASFGCPDLRHRRFCVDLLIRL